MSTMISLTCPNCGGRLKITSDIDRFSCAYCGTEHLVKHGDGIVSLAPVLESLGQVREVVSKTASETAIVRLRGDVEELRKQRDAIANTRDANLNRMLFFAVGGAGIILLAFNVANFPPILLVGAVGSLLIAAVFFNVWSKDAQAVDDIEAKLTRADNEMRKHRSIVNQPSL